MNDRNISAAKHDLYNKLPWMYLVTFHHRVWWLFILSYFKYLALQKVTGVSDHEFWLWVQVIGIKKGFLDYLPDKK